MMYLNKGTLTLLGISFLLAIFANFWDILSSLFSISQGNIELNYFVFNGYIDFNNFLLIKFFSFPLYLNLVNILIYKYFNDLVLLLISFNLILFLLFTWLTFHNLSISF